MRRKDLRKQMVFAAVFTVLTARQGKATPAAGSWGKARRTVAEEPGSGGWKLQMQVRYSRGRVSCPWVREL